VTIYISGMKTLLLISFFLILVNCSAHSIKIGKRCNTPTADGSFEKSFVWVVDRTTLETFDQKINKENCLKNS
jgi:hypothetical protein